MTNVFVLGVASTSGDVEKLVKLLTVGIMDRASACGTNSPGFESHNILNNVFSPLGDEMMGKPVSIKLHDLASPNRKNQVLAICGQT